MHLGRTQKKIRYGCGDFLFCSRLWLTRKKQSHKHGINRETAAPLLRSHFGQLEIEERSVRNVGRV